MEDAQRRRSPPEIILNLLPVAFLRDDSATDFLERFKPVGAGGRRSETHVTLTLIGV